MSNVMGYTHLQGNTINLDETKEKFLKHIMDEIVGYLLRVIFLGLIFLSHLLLM